MTDHATDLLNQGIAALRAGQRDEATRLIQAALRENPHSEQAWLWLSGVLDDPRKQRDCLQRVLSINPENVAARRGLEQLAAKEAASFMASIAPTPEPPPPPPPAPEPDVDQQLAALGVLPIGQQPAPLSPQDEDRLAQTIAQQAYTAEEVAPVVPQHAVLPPPTIAPCAFCGAPDVAEFCADCGRPQIYDCPTCGLPVDLRKGPACRCGKSLQPYIGANGIDHERLGNDYERQGFQAAAIRQWEQALQTSAKPKNLHTKLSNAYRDLGMFDRAAQHAQAAKGR